MNVTLPIHVCIISDHDIEFLPHQASGLRKALLQIQAAFAGQVVLHHGCGTRADQVAHDFARRAGWPVEAHPAAPVAGLVPVQRAAFRGQFEVNPGRPRDERDLQLIWKSSIIVAVESNRGRTNTLLGQAAAAGWEVVHVEGAEFRGELPAVVSGPVHNWLADEWR